MSRGWTTTSDPLEFLASTSEFIEARRVELTVPLSIAHNLARHGERFYGDTLPRLSWYAAHEVGAVAVQTPPHQLVVSPLSTAAAASLAAHREPPYRVLADPGTVLRLAHAWGATHNAVLHERLHRLRRLIAPVSAGLNRLASAGEEEVVWTWQQAFHAEAVGDGPPPSRSRTEVAVAEERVVLHVVDGRAVAMATASRPDAGSSRIGPVYTPPKQRRRGYAASATAAAAQLALQRGAEEVVLFTDLANPTSNALYARLGFVKVVDLIEADLRVGVPHAQAQP